MTDPFTPPSGDPSPSTPPPPQGYGTPPGAWGAPPAPPAPGQQYGAPYGAPYGPPPKNGFGITALVLGIVSLVIFWIPVVGLVVGVLAIVFAVLGRKRVSKGEANNGGFAIAGLVTGIVGTVIGVIWLIAIAFLADEFNNLTDCLIAANGDPVAEQACEREFEDELRG